MNLEADSPEFRLGAMPALRDLLQSIVADRH